MRLRNLLATFIFIIGIGNQTQAQDVHFTMWDMSPLTVNPAFTGSYLGSFRIGGIYRDQWRTIGDIGSEALFTTPSVYIDAPIIRGFRKTDWVGVGMMLFQDQAGSFRLGYGVQHLSASYHLGLNKKQTSVLTLGLQGGNSNLNVDLNRVDISAEDPTEFTALAQTAEVQTSFIDYKVGLLFKTLLNKRMNIAIGAAGGHVTSPRFTLLSGNSGGGTGNAGQYERPLLLQFHGQFGIGMTDKWTFTPQFFYQTTAAATEVSLQAWGGYKFNKDYTLRPGIGYRMTGNDAIEAMLGVDIRDNLRATLAYDFTVSELASAARGVGAFEIAVSYIGKIFKKPDIKPAILCPRL